MRRLLFIVSLFLVSGHYVEADEGMWSLPLLDSDKVSQIEENCLEIPFRYIYSDSENSISDAVIIFNSVGTASVISSEGLVLTNHHCAYEQISALSTPENNILKDGFWASDKNHELPVSGLSVTFIRGMEDVTARVLEGVSDTHSKDNRVLINENADRIVREFSKFDSLRSASIISFFEYNRFVMVVSETYSDIRLVGTPPEFIGKYGGESDNWIWPRHTGDFALFRIYAAADGSPAEYSLDNVPLKTPYHLNVSTEGYEYGDFTMTLGFPGYTRRYLTPSEMEFETESFEIMASIRRPVLELLEKEMGGDESLRLKYASRYASDANTFKYTSGLSDSDDISEIIEDRIDFFEANNKVWKRRKNRRLLGNIDGYIDSNRDILLSQKYLTEFMYSGPDLLKIASDALIVRRNTLLTDNSRERIESQIRSLYGRYDESTDRRIMKICLSFLVDHVSESDLPELLQFDLYDSLVGNLDLYVDNLYDNSCFADEDKCIASWFNDNVEWNDDPVLRLWFSVQQKLIEYNNLISDDYNRYIHDRQLFISYLMNSGYVLYPDANFTLRMSCGSIEGYESETTEYYDYYTTLDELLSKSDSLSGDEYYISDEFRRLAEDNGYLNVNFITNNDITGGNSGSPVFNSDGEVIGLVFDGNRESIPGYFSYDSAVNRSICVDIRYIIFIINNLSGSDRLVREIFDIPQ